MPQRTIDRRDVLRGLGVGGTVGLAGCTGSQDGSDGGSGDGGSGDGGSGDGGSGTPESTPTETPSRLGDTLTGPDGDQVTLTAVYSTGSQTTETTMEFIKQRLAQVGINVELTGVQFQTMLAQFAQNSAEGSDQTSFNQGPEATSQKSWDLMGGIGFNSYPRTPTSIRPFWTDVAETQQATVNFYGYSPSEPIAPRLDEASSSTDEARRQELLATVFGILSRDQPVDFLTFSTNIVGFRNRVAGLGDPGPSFGYDSQTRYFSDTAGGDPAVGGSYISGASSGAKTVNPIRSNDTSSDARIGLTMDGAYSLDNDNEFVPRWVAEYDVNDNRDTYEFFLQDNLEWGGDYGQMTADDWVYYIENVHQAESNWAGDVGQSDWFRNGEPIPVEKTGNLSFEFQLPDTDPAFIKKPVMWGAYCMPKGLIQPYYERVQSASSSEEKTSIGNELNQSEEVQTLAYTGNLGPYDFERWDRTSVFVSTRDPNYYAKDGQVFEGDVPYFEEYQIQVFGEESTRLSALQTGEIVSTGIPPRKIQEFEGNSDINVVKFPTAFCGMLVYNQRSNGWEHLGKRGVRQAISTAIDKVVIAEQINRGTATPAYTHQPEYSQWYDDSKVTRFGGPDSTSIGGAQRLMQEALPSGYSFE
jgi:peptide/nickel transport system substrate-binding protein